MESTPPAAVMRMAEAPAGRRAATWRSTARRLALVVAIATLAVPAPAAAQKVRASNFSDVDFGMLGNLQAESRRSQSLCVYSNGPTNSYSISASGSGNGSAFELSDGSFALPFEVEWSDSGGQSAGAALVPGLALTGQLSSATNQFCNSGPAASASLTIVLRAGDLSTARQGAYSGSLTVVIAAE